MRPFHGPKQPTYYSTRRGQTTSSALHKIFIPPAAPSSSFSLLPPSSSPSDPLEYNKYPLFSRRYFNAPPSIESRGTSSTNLGTSSSSFSGYFPNSISYRCN